MMSDIVEQLSDLLDKERAMLISGDYKSLAPLADAKLTLTEALSEAEGEALNALAEKSKQNAILLDAAARGFQSAMSRLRELSQSGGDAIYSDTGVREPLATPSGKFQKKL